MSSRAPSSSSSSAATKVCVSVRIRPLLPKELSLVQQSCITYANAHQRVLRTSDGKNFQFDEVFLPEASQLQTYDSVVAPLIEGLFNGLNATVFAFGQTGSGKTHTMGTSEGHFSSDLEGISPRALRDIFQHSALLSEGTARDKVAMQFKVGFIEIYNEGMNTIHPSIHPSTYSYIHIFTHSYIHTYIHTYIHAYIYTLTLLRHRET